MVRFKHQETVLLLTSGQSLDINNIVFRRANNIYDYNVTMGVIYEVQRKEITELWKAFHQVFLNMFILWADLETIEKWEALFNIIANPETENLDFRRQRIINYTGISPAYTRIWLERYIATTFPGVETELIITYNDYHVFISVLIHNHSQNLLFRDFTRFLREIIPANMILETELYIPYTHMYLHKVHTYQEMEQFTQGHLSQYA